MPSAPKPHAPARGFLTERQLQVLRLRSQGLSQPRVADQLRTSRENVVILEGRAHRNIARARATLAQLTAFGVAVRLTVEPGTHLVDVPRTVLRRADAAHIKVGANFQGIMEQVRFKAREKIRHGRVKRPIAIVVLPDGDLLID